MGGCLSRPKPPPPPPPPPPSNRPSERQLRAEIDEAINTNEDYPRAERLLRQLIRRKRDVNAFSELPELMDTLADVVDMQDGREAEAANIRNDMRDIALQTLRP